MNKSRIFCVTFKNNKDRQRLFGHDTYQTYFAKDTEWLPQDFNKIPLSYSHEYLSHRELLGTEYIDYLWNTESRPYNAGGNHLREELLRSTLTKVGFTVTGNNVFQTPCKRYIISLVQNRTWYDLRATLSIEHPHFNILNAYGKIPSVLVGHWMDKGGTIEAEHEYHSVNELYNRIIFVTRTIDDIFLKSTC